MKSKTVCAVVTEEVRSRALCCIPFPDSQWYTLCFKVINTKKDEEVVRSIMLKKGVVIPNDKAKLAIVGFSFLIYFCGDIPFVKWFIIQC